MLWILGILVILVCVFTIAEYRKREKLMQEIEASAIRIERLAREIEQTSNKVVEKYNNL